MSGQMFHYDCAAGDQCARHGDGDFTDGGHFIVITGYKDGQFSVNDPYSVINTQKKWDYNRLAPQISGLWAFYRDLSLSTEDFNSEESLETTEETTGQ